MRDQKTYKMKKWVYAHKEDEYLLAQQIFVRLLEEKILNRKRGLNILEKLTELVNKETTQMFELGEIRLLVSKDNPFFYQEGIPNYSCWEEKYPNREKREQAFMKWWDEWTTKNGEYDKDIGS